MQGGGGDQRRRCFAYRVTTYYLAQTVRLIIPAHPHIDWVHCSHYGPALVCRLFLFQWYKLVCAPPLSPLQPLPTAASAAGALNITGLTFTRSGRCWISKRGFARRWSLFIKLYGNSGRFWSWHKITVRRIHSELLRVSSLLFITLWSPLLP